MSSDFLGVSLLHCPRGIDAPENRQKPSSVVVESMKTFLISLVSVNYTRNRLDSQLPIQSHYSFISMKALNLIATSGGADALTFWPWHDILTIAPAAIQSTLDSTHWKFALLHLSALWSWIHCRSFDQCAEQLSRNLTRLRKFASKTHLQHSTSKALVNAIDAVASSASLEP